MKPLTYKWPSIDLLKLLNIPEGQKIWNAWLTMCLRKEDVRDLERVYYGIQRGMDDIVKQKLNDKNVSSTFIRMQRSIEETAKKIYRKKYPNPCDNPLEAKNHMKWYEVKKKRDHEFELWLKRARF